MPPREIAPRLFVQSQEESVQLFLGSMEISHPYWVTAGGREVIDFSRSYAVQFVPALFVPDRNVLLQGRLAILRPSDYDDSALRSRLGKLYTYLRSAMKRYSDSSHTIEQSLESGGHKVWNDMLVGRVVPLVPDLQLKQFINGEIVFRAVPRTSR